MISGLCFSMQACRTISLINFYIYKYTQRYFTTNYSKILHNFPFIYAYRDNEIKIGFIDERKSVAR